MADKYVNATGVQTIKTWVDGKFALDSDLDALSTRVDNIISQGGEPNVIEVVQKNGTALPVSNKTVNVTVPTTVAELSDAANYAEVSDIPTDLSDLTNLGQDPYATESYVDQNGGKIDSISVNGTAQTIDANKNVDLAVATMSKSSNTYTIAQGQNSLAIEVVTTSGSEAVSVGGQSVALASDIPTKVSDLTNDSGYQTSSDVSGAISTALANSGDAYQTASDVSSAISTAVSSAYKYKGSVATVADLPASGNTVGDVYDVQATGMNYAWNGTSWDSLGQYVDTSVFWTLTSGQANTLEAMTVAEINAILNPSA